MISKKAACLLALLLCGTANALYTSLGGRNVDSVANLSEELLERCSLRWFDTNLDHFSRSTGPGGVDSFKLRYYVCDEEKHRKASEDVPAGPIFFYLGNEADVTLYLNATGLMWENAERFGAVIIFAEHRYYGQSLPFGKAAFDNLQWLTSEQALADYATLIRAYKTENGLEDAPVIGFGGSYGGMLGTWARLKYPHVWQGIIAGSAPIWGYMGEKPPLDPGYFAKGVTYDTTQAAGAAPGCTAAIRTAFELISYLAESGREGLETITEAMSICPPVKLNTTDQALWVRDWAGTAFDYMAMGNYPFASSYMLNGHGTLPAFPVRAACSACMDVVGEVPPQPLAQPAGRTGRHLRAQQDEDVPPERLERAFVLRGADSRRSETGDEEETLLAGLAAAVGVWYNYTGDLACFNPWEGVNEASAHIANLWDYQWCSEQFMPNSRDGVTDMFWDEPFNLTEAIEGCKRRWGVEPRPLWADTQWGGRNLPTLSNVVFSNGLYDPWHGGGVLEDLSDTVKAVIIPDGAHHLDLMFTREDDPDDLKEARRVELEEIEKWIAEYHAARRP